jgi:hypothetical protein
MLPRAAPETASCHSTQDWCRIAVDQRARIAVDTIPQPPSLFEAGGGGWEELLDCAILQQQKNAAILLNFL